MTISPGRWRHPRYRLLEPLGEGGMGAVYLAEDLLEERRRVALKTYPRGAPADLLRREFLALRRLRHPGIARALNFGIAEPGGTPFFTLEHLRGEHLDRHLERLFPPPAGGCWTAADRSRLLHTLDLFLQAAGALSHLHRHRLLHLDIKPSNFLVLAAAAEGKKEAPPLGVLIDFGLVRIEGEKRPGTQGTVPYMAPELFRGERIDARTDLYALGAAFYRAFTGRRPFEGETAGAVIQGHLRAPPPPAPEVPLPLARILERLLAKSPERRFPGAAELVDALLAYRKELRPQRAPILPRAEAVELVGRGEEMARVRRWIEEGPGRPPVLAIAGPPGSGRSRLLDEAEALLEAGGRLVAAVRHRGGGEPGLIQALIERIAVLAPPSRDEVRRDLILFGPGGLARKVPDARPQAAGSAAAPGMLAVDTREIARRQAARWIGERILDHGIFLLVDDLEPGAGGSDFIAELFRRLGSAAGRGKPPRGVEKPAGPARGGRNSGGLIIIRDLPGEPAAAGRLPAAAETVELRPLSLEAVGRWIELSGPEVAGTAAARRRLWERTRGLPHLVAWEIRAALSGKLLAGGAASIPEGELEDRMRRLIANLPQPARALVDVLAVFEEAPDADRLAAALGWDAPEVSRPLRLLEAAGLIAVGNGGKVRLVHEPARAWIAAGIPPGRRRRLHASIGALNAGTARERVARAHHLLAAGQEAEAIEAARPLLAAHPLDPSLHSSLALSVLERAAASRRLGRRERAAFLQAAARRLHEEGRLRRAKALWSAVLRTRGLSAAEAVRARRGLAHARYLLGEAAGAERDLLRCLQAIPRNAAERLAPMGDLATIAHYQQRSDRAEEWTRRGLELWERVRRSAGVEARQHAVQLHAILGQVLIRRLRFDEAVKALEAGRRLGRGFPVNLSLLLNNLGLAYHLSSRFQKALAAFRQAERIAWDLSDEDARVPVACNVAQIHAKLGRFREAYELIEELESSPAVAESKRMRLGVLYTRALVDGLRGDSGPERWEEAGELARNLGDRFLDGFIALYRAEAFMAAGCWSAARQLLLPLEGSAGKGRGGDSDFRAAAILGRLAAARRACVEAALARGRPAEAAIASARSGPEATPDLLGAWSGIFIGAALSALGRRQEGEREIRAGMRFFRSRGIVPGSVEAALALAESAARDGDAAACERRLRAVERLLAAHRGEGDLRHAAARLPLLKARVRLLEAAGRADPGDAAGRILDLLAQSEGEPSLRQLAELQLQAACVRYALARIAGPLSGTAAARSLLDETCARLAASLDPGDRASFLALDPLERCGLGAFSLPSRRGEPAWNAQKIRALAALAQGADGGGADRAGSSLESLLERIALPLGGRAAWLLAACRGGSRGKPGPRIEAAWRADPAGSHPSPEPGVRWPALAAIGAIIQPSRRIGGARSWLSAPIRSGSRVAGRLVIASSLRPAELGEEDLLFLETAARTAGFTGAEIGGGTGGRRAGAGAARSAKRERTRAAEETQELTRALDRTREPSRAGSRSRGAEEELVASSRVMRRILGTIDSLRDSDLPVLITGESGTGKEAVARAIHRSSRRGPHPFLVQSVGSIPPALLEADLFGHERGAFTGAERTRSGFLLQARGGTFLLDEVGEAALDVQAKLLRLLEEKRVRPLGGSAPIPLDVRFLATSQRDLDRMVQRGEFRKDLLFRLAAVRIHLPPLRDRPEDILPLCRHFFLTLLGYQPRFQSRAVERLLAHPWPGNARELEAVVRRLALRDRPGEAPLRFGEIEEALGDRPDSGPISPGIFRGSSYDEARRALDLAYIRHLFEMQRGDLGRIARQLGASTRSLYRRLERHGLKPKDLLRELGLRELRQDGKE